MWQRLDQGTLLPEGSDCAHTTVCLRSLAYRPSDVANYCVPGSGQNGGRGKVRMLELCLIHFFLKMGHGLWVAFTMCLNLFWGDFRDRIVGFGRRGCRDAALQR